jgi:hypothetical protein
MVTLEVHGKLVTWDEDFALIMMRYYKNHGVSFIVHRHNAQPTVNFIKKASVLSSSYLSALVQTK